MSIPHVFAPVKPQDFNIRPVTVHKKYVLQQSDLYSGSLPLTGSGYTIWEGLYIGEKLKISSSLYPTNSYDGSLKHIVWKSIDARYYRFPNDPLATFEHSNTRFTRKFLNYSASILAIPYLKTGTSILPGSVEITASGFNFLDDKNGNIYDISIATGSIPSKTDCVAYWGFNDSFRKAKNLPHTFENTVLNYDSFQFEVQDQSAAKNITIQEGVVLNNTASACAAFFSGQSMIFTPHRDEFTFLKADDFTISFWVKHQPTASGTSVLISKSDIIQKQVYGYLDKINQNDLVVPTMHVSWSTEYEPTPIYPYRFEVNSSNRLLFKRSDGKDILSLSGSINLNDSKWHHYAAVKSGSSIYLYQDSIIVQSGSEVTYNPVNSHVLVFGTKTFDYQDSFVGGLDEVRMYNKGLTTSQIQTLANSSSMQMYQTAVVGNVFYKNGTFVVSAPDAKYNKLFSNTFTVKYRSTHTIYEYETLVRIKKGSFNLSQNPTILKSPNSDLIIDDATGSLANGSLFPYATSVGLYNDKAELLAVAKLNQPLMMRDDVDINILVKWNS